MADLVVMRAKNLEVREIDHFPKSDTGEFWTRYITFHGEECEFVVKLFAYSRADLLLPGEKDAEAEKRPPAGTEGPSESLGAVELTAEQADGLLEQVRRTF